MVNAEIEVEVVYCAGPRLTDAVTLRLPAGSTLGDAMQASGVLSRHPGLAQAGLALKAGVWGRFQPLEHVLRNRDRVEIYRPLTVDPKEARRLRYKRHKEKDKAAARGAG